jgi:hypothetical protein
MRRRVVNTTATFAAILVLLAAATGTGAFLINKDVKQPFEDPQDNYEVVIEGDWRGVQTDQDHVINPFANGEVQISYDSGPPERTTVSFSGDPISQGPYYRHFGFGYGISESHDKIVAQYWTHGTAQSEVPGASDYFHYNAETYEMIVTVGNDTENTIVVRDVGYLPLYEEAPLDTMNREMMPPEGFIPTEIVEMTLTSGDSTSFVIPEVNPDMYIVVFQSVEFLEPPNEYTEDEGIWVQIPVSDLAAVESESLGKIKSEFR